MPAHHITGPTAEADPSAPEAPVAPEEGVSCSVVACVGRAESAGGGTPGRSVARVALPVRPPDTLATPETVAPRPFPAARPSGRTWGTVIEPGGDDMIPALGLVAAAGTVGVVMAAGWIVVATQQKRRDNRGSGPAVDST